MLYISYFLTRLKKTRDKKKIKKKSETCTFCVEKQKIPTKDSLAHEYCESCSASFCSVIFVYDIKMCKRLFLRSEEGAEGL